MEYNKLRYQVQKQNGRVIDIAGEVTGDFPLFEQKSGVGAGKSGFNKSALMGIVQESELSRAFLCEGNIERLQDEIRYRVWRESQMVVDRQSDTDLKIIMRATYLQYATNNGTRTIASQVEELNRAVSNYAVPNIISKAQQFIGYLQDIESNPVPIPLPTNVSSAGTRVLPSVASTF